ncbi:MAG: ribbon-helix-helix domain-containing protein [Candidatus Bipolaricaulota bacterium]|nr:ribbon-helix-helix domain-containing protein [Candidatus Bipolaricaulota bacterium]
MGTQVAERKTQVYFPEELHRQLKEYARRNEISMAEAIRQAVRRYLQDEGLSASDWENDPINKIIGMAKDVNVTDGSENHDYYAYGFPLKRKFRKDK